MINAINYFNPWHLPTQGCLNFSATLQDAIKQGSLEGLNLDSDQLNTPLPNGYLPLHFAILENREEAALALIDAGADPELKDTHGINALEHAVHMGRIPLFLNIVLKKLGKSDPDTLISKPSLHHRTISIDTTFATKEMSPNSRAAYEGTLEVTELVANQADSHGLFPIHYAILGGQLALVKQLLEIGKSSPFLVSGNGTSLLHFATLSKNEAVLQFLCEQGLDPNLKNKQGLTPVHFAALQGNISHLRILVEHQGQLNIRDNQGMFPLDQTVRNALIKDPLALSISQQILFATTAIYWLSTALTSGWTEENSYTLYIAEFINSIAINNALTHLMKGSYSSFVIGPFILECAYLFGYIPPLLHTFSGLTFTLLKTYAVAHNSFEGIRKCYHYGAYRPLAVLRNILALTINTAHSVHILKQKLHPFFEAFETYQNSIGPTQLTELSDQERINHPGIDRKDVDTALAAVMPREVQEGQLRRLKSQLQSGERIHRKACNRLRKEFSSEVHQQYKITATNLNELCETLDKNAGARPKQEARN